MASYCSDAERMSRIEAKVDMLLDLMEQKSREYSTLYGQYCSMIAWNRRLMRELGPDAAGRATAEHMESVAEKRET